MKKLHLEIPLIPPTVNHYKEPAIFRDRSGSPRKGMRVTPYAKSYKAAIATFARGDSVAPATAAERKRTGYSLTVTVYLGHKQRGDGDNFWKCIADGLVDAGVIHSDAAVANWGMTVARDRDNPRTVIDVEAFEKV